ncbi:MAG: Wadjet anti-phage system protein JetA family protein [Mobilitalea sp.]
MNELQKIPQEFWNLFRSSNRYIYIEALIAIYDEYLYNDYFLTRETCIRLVSEHFEGRLIDVSADDDVIQPDSNEPTSTQIVNKLTGFTWLKKVEDYVNFRTNITIPDYAAIFIEALIKLDNPDEQETEIEIQNIYSNLYSFYNDKKLGIEMLNSAKQNATKLNRSLQNMLHNMDRFFESLLGKTTYEEVLTEHLEIFVETEVSKKYGLLKTSDNFYKYKNDIKDLLGQLQEDENRLYLLKRKIRSENPKKTEEEIDIEYNDLIYEIDRSISNMETRIAHIDAEHSKYIRATVSRMEYLLSRDQNLKGNLIALLNIMGTGENEEVTKRTTEIIRINDFAVNSEDSFYKKRAKKIVVGESDEPEEEQEEDLSKGEILKANKSTARYSKANIESFILDNMKESIYKASEHPITSAKEFELMILAFDHSYRIKSPFELMEEPEEMIVNGEFSYPNAVFKLKK